MNKCKNQSGFAPLAILLVVVLVAAVGGAAYYVGKHNSKKSTDSYVSTPAATKTTSPAPAADSNAGYFVIKEWGVHAKYSGSQHLTYSFAMRDAGAQVNNRYASFNSTELAASNSSVCMGGLDGAGIIERLAPSDHVFGEDGSDEGTAEAFFAAPDAGNYQKLGNYYYWYDHPQAPCTDNIGLNDQADNYVRNLVGSLTPIAAQ
jgi:hypothetical protein